MKMTNISVKAVEQLRNRITNLKGVQSVEKIGIVNTLIECVRFKHASIGDMVLRRLTSADGPGLFDFYLKGLSETSRNHFPPYPLFDTTPESAGELTRRIKNWEIEDDWTVLKLEKDGNLVGICLLKRYRTDQASSGLAVREEFQKQGLGTILQTIITEQAHMLGLKRLHITLAENNASSLQVHLKSGFKRTGRLVPHYRQKDGVSELDRHDIEMVIEFE
jgi:RimJ/RimL family protein N-acetyltransferase